ncbi:hypothetical protein MFLO_09737 [Listeria floridensis FSL S10-1187]|uniref:Quinate/shikimate 5-dehydrogenase/glutamyl-tRNA reductase domain-containing protein n=1 Tax=Listeria floridensis FSL S10-1187 TaxID=1265817 RepID=A0ABN0REH3_9LIST|nr:NAD(P)-binding domain-containing protein [Listeria floridensis]EUJ30967.1 hypothetical protein MFLO_09737 [Listeria floridensis FSL S10-1187]
MKELVPITDAYTALEQIDFMKYQYAMFTSTANATNRDQILPDRLTPFGNLLNIQLASQAFAEHVFNRIDGYIPNLLVDAERKQLVPFYSLAKSICTKSTVHLFKANDVTVNATLNTLNIHYTGKISGLSVLIYGTGNLAAKLALKLAELGAKVYLIGRSEAKAAQLAEAMNLILPAHSPHNIKVLQTDEKLKVDVMVSAISAKKKVHSDWLSFLERDALILDVGIDNYAEEFIEKAVQNGHVMQRVDIQARIGTEIADIETRDFYAATIRGIRELDGKTAVAGGIIGKKGDLVLDKITEPYHIIGYSNGTGGLMR